MKILILARNTGESLSPQAFLAERLISEWGETGNSVVVITESHRQARDSSTTISVEKSWRPRAGRFFRFLPGLSRYSLPQFQFAKWASTTIRAIGEFGPDVVITFSNPYMLNVVGLLVKRLQPQITWVAHYSDPILDSPYKRLSRLEGGPLRRLEAKIVGSADGIVFCNSELRKVTLKRHSGQTPSTQTATIYHSYDEADYQGPVRVEDRPVLRHIGSIYGARKTEALFEALAELRKLSGRDFSVELIGSRLLSEKRPSPRASKREATEWWHDLPIVSKEESIGLMRSAPVLFSLDAVEKPLVFLPSKLIEYIRSERPVIVFSSPGSPSWKLGLEFGLFLADIRDRSSIQEATARALDAVSTWKPDRVGMTKFSSKRIAVDWLAFIRSLEK